MNSPRTTLYEWIAGQFTARLKSAFEGYTGKCPQVESGAVADLPSDAAFRWRQPFTGIAGAVWIACSEAAWSAAGGCLLRANELPDDDPANVKAEFLEIARQALSGVAQAMGGRLQREILCAGGGETDLTPRDPVWTSLTVTVEETVFQLLVGAEGELLKAMEGIELEIASEAALAASSAPPAAHEKSQTFEMLLDVELPVSVSFGRAQVPLKEVLKLTSGSIVELNRTIGDPVEVIVNNCVIARGEVVTVDGNFGVRIQHVISRQERWRTLS